MWCILPLSVTLLGVTAPTRPVVKPPTSQLKLLSNLFTFAPSSSTRRAATLIDSKFSVINAVPTTDMAWVPVESPSRRMSIAPERDRKSTRFHLRRSSFIAVACAAATLPMLPVCAAIDEAEDLVATVGQLSTQARTLQLFVRTSAAQDYASVRKRVVGERPKLRLLRDAMKAAAPGLRICSAETADCDCTPNTALMSEATRQASVVAEQLVALDAALDAGARGIEQVETGALLFRGGAVEQALENICEAADLYLDLASGRGRAAGMLARVAPITRP